MPATAESSPRFAGGERKQVTVLFADFSGFTAFSDKLDAEEVRDYMVSVWDRLDSVLQAHGGTIEKHIGDAIMAVFGAKQAREEDPEQAVRAALAMQSCVGQVQDAGFVRLAHFPGPRKDGERGIRLALVQQALTGPLQFLAHPCLLHRRPR